VSKVRVRDVWVGTDHPWRAWAKLAPFAAIPEAEVIPAIEGAAYRGEIIRWGSADPAPFVRERTAIIVDLPGPDAIDMGLALGQRGYRPVPSMNTASAMFELIDMAPVLERLMAGARFASAFPTGPAVPPAFLLDSRRDGGGVKPVPNMFDNRWFVFPTDLPPAEQLQAAGITTVLIVQDEPLPREDVEAIGWAYQRGGLTVRVADVRSHREHDLDVPLHGWWTRVLRRARRRIAFHRRWDGSYGERIPIPPEPSHG
jgi:hypothetical protein